MMFQWVFLMLAFTITSAFNITRVIQTLINTTLLWDNVVEELVNGSLVNYIQTISKPGGHLAPGEVTDLLNNLTLSYHHQQQIGKTFKGEPILVYSLTTQKLSNESKKGIFITSLHHAREVATLQMNLYLYLHFIYKMERSESKTAFLLDTSIIWMHPFVNLDGYKKVEDLMLKQGILYPQVRKNLHIENTCDDYSYEGVDLNRNYAYKYGTDSIGSQTNQCAEDYRGKSAFSEPETAAIETFITSTPSIKMSINLHCFGNLWIIPFNYDPSGKNIELQGSNYTEAANIYQEFKGVVLKSGDKFRYGNAKNLVGYAANGEASDWMLHEKGIIVISPELGRQLEEELFHPRNFFPNQDETRELFKDDIDLLNYFINYLPLSLMQANLYLIMSEIKQQKENDTVLRGIYTQFGINADKKDVIAFSIELKNHGLGQTGISDKFYISINASKQVFEVIYQTKSEALFNELHSFQIDYQQMKRLTQLEKDADFIRFEAPQINSRDFVRLTFLTNGAIEFTLKFAELDVFQTKLQINEQDFNMANNKTEETPSSIFIQYKDKYFANITKEQSYTILCILLVLCVVLFFFTRRRKLEDENDRQKLFKQNINKIFKVDEEF